MDCVFCAIARGEMPAALVLETAEVLVFLDRSPLFHGHCLVVPREHHETLPELPAALIEPYFGMVQKVAAALPRALEAEGSFIGMNNRISQSVPHVHTHVVPRRRKDGLRGFFWPRRKYADFEAMQTIARRIRDEL